MSETSPPFTWKERAGVALMAVSFVLSWSILAVPWLGGTFGEKAMIAGALAVSGEVVFWIAVLVAGRAFMQRYRVGALWQKYKAEWLRNARDENDAPSQNLVDRDKSA